MLPFSDRAGRKNRYSVMSGNAVRKANISKLKEKLEKSIPLDKEGLKNSIKPLSRTQRSPKKEAPGWAS